MRATTDCYDLRYNFYALFCAILTDNITIDMALDKIFGANVSYEKTQNTYGKSEIVKKVLELKREGMRPRDIAKQIGKETTYVTAIIHRYGLSDSYQRTTADTYKIMELNDMGIGYKEIAERLGYNRSTVYSVLRRQICKVI